MPVWKKKDNLIIAGFVVLFFSGLIFWQDFASVRAALPGATSLPSATFLDKDEKSHTLAEFKGKPFIVVFWATWCPVCVQKMATLNSFAKRFHEKGGQVVTISEDRNNLQKVQGYHTQHKYDNLPIFLDDNEGLMAALDPAGLPTAVFFDAGGREVWRIAGGVDWESPEMHDTVKAYLGIQVGKATK